jgi:ferredoxin
MPVTISKDRCIRCGMCIDECPSAAIYYGNGNEAKLIGEDCNDCGLCITICVATAISA